MVRREAGARLQWQTRAGMFMDGASKTCQRRETGYATHGEVVVGGSCVVEEDDGIRQVGGDDRVVDGAPPGRDNTRRDRADLSILEGFFERHCKYSCPGVPPILILTESPPGEWQRVGFGTISEPTSERPLVLPRNWSASD